MTQYYQTMIADYLDIYQRVQQFITRECKNVKGWNTRFLELNLLGSKKEIAFDEAELSRVLYIDKQKVRHFFVVHYWMRHVLPNELGNRVSKIAVRADRVLVRLKTGRLCHVGPKGLAQLMSRTMTAALSYEGLAQAHHDMMQVL